MEILSRRNIKRLLVRSQNVLIDSRLEGWSVPWSSPDLSVTCKLLTSSEYRRIGPRLDIRYGFFDSAFGMALVMQTDGFVCGLAFVLDDKKGTLAEMGARWKSASFTQDVTATEPLARRVFTLPEIRSEKEKKPIPLLLKGTEFQIQVWQTLLRIPPGYIVSYKQIATCIGYPRAVRAVGGAVASNPIAYLVPCHRVIRGDGLIGGYHWGVTRKGAILAREAARFPHI